MAILGSWSTGTLPTVTGSVTLASGVGIPTSPALLANNTAGAAFAQFPIASPANLSVRFYARTPPAWVSAAFTICSLRPSPSSTAVVINLGGTGAPGQVRLVRTGGTTVSQSPTGTLQPNTDYRFEILYSKPLLAAEVSVFPMGSDVPVWTASATDAAWGVDLTRVDIGLPQATPVISSFHIDSIEITDTGSPVGRAAGDELTVVPTTVQYWDGTTLKTATVQYWNGTSLVPVGSVKYWDGTNLLG